MEKQNKLQEEAANVKNLLQKLAETWEDSSLGAFSKSERFHRIAESLIEASENFAEVLREEIIE
jgi:hypothetical protein